MMRDFTYGFTHLLSKRKYEVHAFIWYFKNDETDIDGAAVIGIAPCGCEGLVAATIKQIREQSVGFQSRDATIFQLEQKDSVPVN